MAEGHQLIGVGVRWVKMSGENNKIAAAVIGLIVNAIIGIDNIDIGPAKPPFDIPKRIIPIEAVK